ncbi:TPA: IS110 family transposase [Escherichia coli]|nr:IS110 family transposase [Escherichia coli]
MTSLLHRITRLLLEQTVVVARAAARLFHRDRLSYLLPKTAHLASYAGLAPVTRRSNSSIRNKRPSRRSNPPSTKRRSSQHSKTQYPRFYHTCKMGQEARHTRALITLARRFGTLLFVMICNGTLHLRTIS